MLIDIFKKQVSLFGDKKKKNTHTILLICDQLGATQTISFLRPLQHLVEKKLIDFQIITEPDLQGCSESDIRKILSSRIYKSNPLITILSRYSGTSIDAILDELKHHKIPSIFHIDDDLYNVPSELGESKFKHYNNPERQARLKKATLNTDLIYTSTATLADRVTNEFGAINVYHGPIYCGVNTDQIRKFHPPSSEAKIIGYMGTGGHTKDLEIVAPAITELLKTRDDIDFELFGTIKMPKALQEFGERVRKIPPTDNYESFLDKLGKLRWTIGLAPLTMSEFNKAKANTKWIEYSFAGIPVIASDHPVYRESASNNCALLCSDDEWQQCIEKLLNNTDELMNMVNNAQKKIMEQYSMQLLQNQILDCFRIAGADLKALATLSD